MTDWKKRGKGTLDANEIKRGEERGKGCMEMEEMMWMETNRRAIRKERGREENAQGKIREYYDGIKE